MFYLVLLAITAVCACIVFEWWVSTTDPRAPHLASDIAILGLMACVGGWLVLGAACLTGLLA